MARPHGAAKRTKAELAAQTLRNAIRSGRLPPGTRLPIQELADEMAISYTPVREALYQLQSEGLVTYRPHLGKVVAEYGKERAEEIYRLRSVLEPLAARLAVQFGGAEEFAAIEAAYAQLSEAVAEGRVSEVPLLNTEFHLAIVLAAGSPLLLEFVERLWNGVPFQATSIQQRILTSAAEHAEIMRALRKRDADAAEREIRAHIAGGFTRALPNSDVS